VDKETKPTLLETRRLSQVTLSTGPDLLSKKLDLLKQLDTVERQRRSLHTELRQIDERLEDAVRAERHLFGTACLSEREYLLNNEINALYHSVSSRPDKRGTVEPRLKELYAERAKVQQTRLDPEQCLGGKREWAPPPDEFAESG
jgi:hypothetical protein